MKRFLIVFVSVVTLLAFFSSCLAIDRNPKESKAKEKEKPTEFKEGKKESVKVGKTKEIPQGRSERIEQETKAGERTKEKVPEKLTKWLKSREEQKAKEKYDYFLDKNNNGIDDRLEKKSKEPVSTPAIRPVPKEKQPTKSAPSSNKTGEKIEIKKTPKEKEVKKTKKVEGKKRR